MVFLVKNTIGNLFFDGFLVFLAGFPPILLIFHGFLVLQWYFSLIFHGFWPKILLGGLPPYF